ncbi:MAG: CesT family type III secretion system chaperone [Bdellovibrionales bacterium]|nr:CesT family type III secretion system chaperone [Bdellovibrionales bacterium]
MKRLISAWVVLMLCSTSVSAESSARLDAAALKQMVTNLGLTVSDGAYASGASYVLAVFPWGGYNYEVKVSGGGQEKIWIVADLGTVPSERKVPKIVLEKLLDANFDAVRSYFSLDKETGEMRIKVALPNEGLSPVALRSAIQEVVEQMHNTRSVWRFDEWPAVETAAAPASAKTTTGGS